MRSSAVPDIVLEIENTIPILELMEIYLKKAKISRTAVQSIRLFYSGRELKGNKLIGEYFIPTDTVIQVFLQRNQTLENKI